MEGGHVHGNSQITSMPSERSRSPGLSSPVTLFSWGSLVGPLLLGLAQTEHVPRPFRGPGEEAVATDPAPARALWGSRACLVLAAPAVLGFQAHVHLRVEGCLSGLRPSFFGMKMEDEGSHRPPAWAGLTPPHILLPRASPCSVPGSEGGATAPPQLLSPHCLHPGAYAHRKGAGLPSQLPLCLRLRLRVPAFLNSLRGNTIKVAGAKALANALKVNSSLRRLK